MIGLPLVSWESIATMICLTLIPSSVHMEGRLYHTFHGEKLVCHSAIGAEEETFVLKVSIDTMHPANGSIVLTAWESKDRSSTWE